MVKTIILPAEKVQGLSSNWKAMLESKKITTGNSQYRTMVGIKGTGKGLTQAATEVVAIDCEMVTVKDKTGEEKSALARVSIVDENNMVLIDSYVRPTSYIVDYKTEVSGIKPGHLRNAPELDKIKPKIEELLRNKIVVGHAIWNDLEVLELEIPQELIRDTAKCPLLRLPDSSAKTMSLKRLCEHWLDLTIQEGEHDSVVDAKATLRLYKLKKVEWEKFLKRPKHVQQQIIEDIKEGKVALGAKKGSFQVGALKGKSSDDVVTFFSDDEEDAAKPQEKLVVPDAFKRASSIFDDDEFHGAAVSKIAKKQEKQEEGPKMTRAERKNAGNAASAAKAEDKNGRGGFGGGRGGRGGSFGGGRGGFTGGAPRFDKGGESGRPSGARGGRGGRGGRF